MNKLIKKITMNGRKVKNGEEELVDFSSLPFTLGGQDKEKQFKHVSSKYHSLFIEKDKTKSESITIPLDKLKDIISEDQINKFEADAFEGGLTLATPEIEFKKFTLHIGDFMHFESDVTALNNLLYEIDIAEEDDICSCHISSDGGSIEEYIKIRQHLVSAFGGKLTTIVDPNAYSAGAMLFVAGHNRIVYEDCSLMFHTYKAGAWGTGTNLSDTIIHYEDRFNNLFHREIVEPGYMTEEEFIEYKLGKEFWLTFDKLIERGVATHVILGQMILSVEDYIKLQNGEPVEGIVVMNEAGEIIQDVNCKEITTETVEIVDEKTKTKQKPKETKTEV